MHEMKKRVLAFEAQTAITVTRTGGGVGVECALRSLVAIPLTVLPDAQG